MGKNIMTTTAEDLLSQLSRANAQGLISAEQSRYVAARGAGDVAGAWSALERMHILSQPFLWPHLHSHLEMFGYAVSLRNWREVFGQALRLALAPFGALTGWLPWGNTGRAGVSAFAPMALPLDVRATLEGLSRSSRQEVS
jgi:hypothetical protein